MIIDYSNYQYDFGIKGQGHIYIKSGGMDCDADIFLTEDIHI